MGGTAPGGRPSAVVIVWRGFRETAIFFGGLAICYKQGYVREHADAWAVLLGATMVGVGGGGYLDLARSLLNRD